MRAELPNFIVIDDDPISNIICLNIIRLTFPGASVQTFKEAEEGVEHLLSVYSADNCGNAILFLDINMPVLNGWEVLEKITDFPASLKEHVKIFMLSSSVASDDQEKAENHPLVSGYITKSLSQAKLSALFPEINLK